LWKWLYSEHTVEKEYKQFLYLIATNPNRTIVPWSQTLDDFWHEHILDTQKYETDCKKIFGKFVHHDPHIVDSKQKTACNETKKMYKQAFKEKAEKKKDSGSSCGAGCGSGYIHKSLQNDR
jgi:hypothetical protein